MELYKQLQDQNAFEKVPIEVKIVYSEQIYSLYSQISELCHTRGKRLAELTAVDWNDWRQVRYYNVCEEVIQSVDSVLSKYRKSKDADENKIRALQDLRGEVFDYTEQIKGKFALLQENMEKKLKCSIGNEE